MVLLRVPRNGTPTIWLKVNLDPLVSQRCLDTVIILDFKWRLIAPCLSGHVRKCQLPKWSRHPVDCITAQTVNEWIGELSTCRHFHRSTLSPRSASSLEDGLEGRKSTTHQSKEQEESVCYTPEEMGSIIAQAQGMWKVLCATAAETAARAGELYWLEVADIDFARNIIHVRRSVWEGHKLSTKSRNANRTIDVQPNLVTMLKDYLNGRQVGLVFPAKNGKPLRNNNVLRRRHTRF
jgi:Phage integrase family